MTFHVGDIWVPVATITDPTTEQPVKPTTVTFHFKTPAGTETTGTVTEKTTGVYESTIELTEPGTWTVSIQSTGNGYQASTPAQIIVAGQWQTHTP
jgi:nitrogen fixation protein FixH